MLGGVTNLAGGERARNRSAPAVQQALPHISTGDFYAERRDPVETLEQELPNKPSQIDTMSQLCDGSGGNIECPFCTGPETD